VLQSGRQRAQYIKYVYTIYTIHIYIYIYIYIRLTSGVNVLQSGRQRAAGGIPQHTGDGRYEVRERERERGREGGSERAREGG
jgi:hypothetical protein